jgi:site-specific DNA-methyltransferase (adenine-specific)
LPSEIKLFNKDCMEAMKEMPDKAFDLAIVDPPYGIGVNQMNMGGRQTVKPTNKKWDDCIPTADYFNELMRVSKEQIIWGGNYFPLRPSRGFVVWDKGETMYGRDFAECELAWMSMDKSARMYKLSPNQPERFHPTQKPVKLYQWLLLQYAPPQWENFGYAFGIWFIRDCLLRHGLRSDGVRDRQRVF